MIARPSAERGAGRPGAERIITQIAAKNTPLRLAPAQALSAALERAKREGVFDRYYYNNNKSRDLD